LWLEGGGSLGRVGWGLGGLGQKTSQSAKEPGGQKHLWEKRVGQRGTGGSMSLPAVLMSGRRLPEGETVKSGQGGVPEGKELPCSVVLLIEAMMV